MSTAVEASPTVTIALDAMSGDLGAKIAVQAALAAIQKHTDINITLVGDEAVLSPLLKAKFKDRLTVHLSLIHI